MKIGFYRVGGAPRWHTVLAQRLAARGLGVCALPGSDRATGHDLRSSALNGLLMLERTLSGGTRSWLSDTARRIDDDRFWSDKPVCAAVDLVIAGSACWERTSQVSRERMPMLVPTFDGQPDEIAMWDALLNGRAPVLGVLEAHTGQMTMLALPALESPHRILESAEAVLTHLVASLDRFIGAIANGQQRPVYAISPPAAPTAGLLDVANAGASRRALRALARRVGLKAAKARDGVLKRAPVWQVAYRSTETRTHAGQLLPADAFRLLPDDGQRYYADPFVVAHEGLQHVFVEEFPYASGRGVISHFTIGDNRIATRPRVVLEEPHHLSYPQVFQHDGQMWMMPEASAAGRLDLYRAARFPDRWVHRATLIEAPLHDATFFAHAGRLWILAGTTVPGASCWDTLALYYAERLEGPWHAHPMNPVLVDARAARPAGELFIHNGHVWRPAQDCTGGYGSALTLNRVSALNPEQFAQSLEATLRFDRGARGLGPHTINFSAGIGAGGIEIIDIFQPRPRR